MHAASCPGAGDTAAARCTGGSRTGRVCRAWAAATRLQRRSPRETHVGPRVPRRRSSGSVRYNRGVPIEFRSVAHGRCPLAAGRVANASTSFVALTEPVAETVRRDDVEHLPRRAAALLDI